MHRINPYTTATQTVSNASPILRDTPPGQDSKQETGKSTNPLIEVQILVSSKSQPQTSSIPSEVDRVASDRVGPTGIIE